MPIFVDGESPIIGLADLTPFATIDDTKAGAMISSALARAARVAPCINDSTLSADHVEAFKSILRDAILRWNDSGSGAFQQRTQTAGSFSLGETYDTRQPRRSLFWPSEVEEMQAICKEHAGEEKSGAFSVDTAPSLSGLHADWCALNFGATYCSCGADIAGVPIFEQG